MPSDRGRLVASAVTCPGGPTIGSPDAAVKRAERAGQGPVTECQVRSGLRPSPPLFAAVAAAYLESGLGFPLPVPARAQGPVPRNFEYRRVEPPTRAQVKRWAAAKPASNVLLRPADGVVAVVTTTGAGRDLLADLERRLGLLPATIISTDGAGTTARFFTAPYGTVSVPFLGDLDEVAILQHGYGQLVVWPSVIHWGLARRDCSWLELDGSPAARVPGVTELAELPPCGSSTSPLPRHRTPSRGRCRGPSPWPLA